MQRARLIPWLLAIPATALLLSVVLGPLAFSLGISFYKWPTPGNPLVFVGLGNYARILTDERFFNSLSVTAQFVAASVSLEFLLGLVMALTLSRVNGRPRSILSTYLLIPSMLAPVAVGYVWFLLFSAYYGPISYVLSLLFNIPPIEWIASSGSLALFSLIVAEVWEWTPFVMMVLLSGLLALPREPFEAAQVDGAPSWQIFRRITIPLLRPIILVVLIIRTVDALKVYDLVAVITRGGPGSSTELLSWYISLQGFSFWDLSYAASLSYVMLVIVNIIVVIYIRMVSRL